MIPSEQARRFSPRPWDTDWLMLRGLNRALAAQLADTANPGDQLLDFGCGTMPYRALVEQLGLQYIGADFGNVASVEITNAGHVAVASDSMDIVLSVQVLEHVRDLSRYLNEAGHVLKDGGVLLLSTHGTWLYHPHPEDHRRWTRTGLVLDIESYGFKVEQIEAIVGPLATATIIRLTGYAFLLRRAGRLGGVLANALTVFMNARAFLEDWITPQAIRRDNGCIYVARCMKLAAQCSN